MHEQLAHRDRRGALGANHFEPVQKLRRQRILQVEQPIVLELLRQPHRLDRRHALVNVVDELDVEADLRAHPVKQLRHAAGVGVGMEVRAGQRAVRRHAIVDAAVRAPLATHVSDALLDIPRHAVRHFLQVATVRVAVDRRRLATFAAEQVVHRHIRDFSLNVPQRHIDARDRVVQNGTVAPVRADHRRLPNVLGAPNVFADEKRLQILVDRRRDRKVPLGERRAAETVQSRFGRLELDDDQVNVVGSGQYRFHVPNDDCAHDAMPPSR